MLSDTRVPIVITDAGALLRGRVVGLVVSVEAACCLRVNGRATSGKSRPPSRRSSSGEVLLSTVDSGATSRASPPARRPTDLGDEQVVLRRWCRTGGSRPQTCATRMERMPLRRVVRKPQHCDNFFVRSCYQGEVET
jgi:hypothetical protein